MAWRKRKRTGADYEANYNYADAADRLEVILDCLTEPTKTAKVDRAAAARAISCFRRLAAVMEPDGAIESRDLAVPARAQAMHRLGNDRELAFDASSQKQPLLRLKQSPRSWLEK